MSFLAALLLLQPVALDTDVGSPRVLPVAEKAPYLRYTAPMYPYLLQYAACLFEAQNLAPDERIQQCQDRKTAIWADATITLEKWHDVAAETRGADLAEALDDLETETRFAFVNRQPVPDVIIRYLECAGNYLVDRKGFRKGLYIEYHRADVECGKPVRQARKDDTTGVVKQYYSNLRMSGSYRRPVPRIDAWIPQGDIALLGNDNGLLEPIGER